MTAFLYVIEADNGEVKVGWSGTPFARLSQVKREYAARRGFTSARLVAMVRTTFPLEAEIVAQRHLRPFWVDGEWFRVEPLHAVTSALWASLCFDDGASVRWGRTG